MAPGPAAGRGPGAADVRMARARRALTCGPGSVRGPYSSVAVQDLPDAAGGLHSGHPGDHPGQGRDRTHPLCQPEHHQVPAAHALQETWCWHPRRRTRGGTPGAPPHKLKHSAESASFLLRVRAIHKKGLRPRSFRNGAAAHLAHCQTSDVLLLGGVGRSAPRRQLPTVPRADQSPSV